MAPEGSNQDPQNAGTYEEDKLVASAQMDSKTFLDHCMESLAESMNSGVLAHPVPPLKDDCPCTGWCPLDRIVGIIGGKWKIKAICLLYGGKSMRYNQLKRRITGITPAVLTTTLRDLEDQGIISRTVYDERPVRVEYALTEIGQTLIPLLGLLRHWSIASLPSKEAACN